MAKSTSKPAISSPQSAPDANASPEAVGNKPVHTIRYRSVKVAIWQNDSNNGLFYSVTISRSWQDERKDWHDSQSFNAGDLPTLAKAVNDAHSWIAWQERQRKQSAAS